MMGNEIPEDEVHSSVTSPNAASANIAAAAPMVREQEGASGAANTAEQPKTEAPKTEEAPQSSSTSRAPSSSPSSSSSPALPLELVKTSLTYDFGTYEGEVNNANGLRHGYGTLRYNSGNTYTGEWADGAANGFGEKVFKNGDVYRGMWVDGKRSGRGSYLHKEGHFFEGMYVDDVPEGYGVLTTVGGDRYAGGWHAGKKEGKGRETLANGQVFIGRWRNGKKQGRGKMFVAGAKRFFYGIWNEDKFFRELAKEEMHGEADCDIVDEYGIPRELSSGVSHDCTEGAPKKGGVLENFATGLSEKVERGVSAMEEKLERLGRALERATAAEPEPRRDRGAALGTVESEFHTDPNADDKDEEPSFGEKVEEKLEKYSTVLSEKLERGFAGVEGKLEALGRRFEDGLVPMEPTAKTSAPRAAAAKAAPQAAAAPAAPGAATTGGSHDNNKTKESHSNNNNDDDHLAKKEESNEFAVEDEKDGAAPS